MVTGGEAARGASPARRPEVHLAPVEAHGAVVLDDKGHVVVLLQGEGALDLWGKAEALLGIDAAQVQVPAGGQRGTWPAP